MPTEMLDEMIQRMYNPIDLQRIASTCEKFRIIVAAALWRRVCEILARNGVPEPHMFLWMLYKFKIYFAGPVLLSAIHPDFHSPVYANRLEFHVPHKHQAVNSLIDYLYDSGFRQVSSRYGTHGAREYAADNLGYESFGHTILKIIQLRKPIGGGQYGTAFIYVSRSKSTALLSIMEYPSTLFMVAVDGISLHIFYPGLTCYRRGLINQLLPRNPVRPMAVPSSLHSLMPFFDLKMELSDWAEFSFHICHTHVNCPLRMRTSFDNRALVLVCNKDAFITTRPPIHDPLRQYWVSPADRAARQVPWVAWTLMCCGSCAHRTAFERQQALYEAVYIAPDFHFTVRRY